MDLEEDKVAPTNSVLAEMSGTTGGFNRFLVGRGGISQPKVVSQVFNLASHSCGRLSGQDAILMKLPTPGFSWLKGAFMAELFAFRIGK